MENMTQQWQIPEGTDVVGADGEKVGKVVAADASSIVVEKGFFFPTDSTIPTSAINSFDGDKVYLNVTKDQALTQGWNQPLGNTSVSGDDTTRSSHATTLRGAETDTLRVPVHEEELTATKRAVERGQVEITTNVIAEERTLEVPITEERVTVTRRAVDRDAQGDSNAFEEGTIEVPLHRDEVELQKRTRVAEEIEIGKEAVQRTERVAGTVRREEVSVVDQSDADVTDGTSGTTATTRGPTGQ